MERQLTLLTAIDDKKVQKEVSILKEYRALKMRFSNEVEQEGISLFPELRDSRNTSKWKVQQKREDAKVEEEKRTLNNK
ncbi:ArpU family transcriptional regulator [Bacillus cereus]|nr:ArpU family transcriptional regulator [Bacillus cereus]